MVRLLSTKKKRQAVLDAMESLQFRPNVFARGLAGGNSMTIGIVTQNIGSPFYDQVTQGVIQSLSKTDYSPIFVDGQWDPQVEQRVVQTLLDRQVDGMIIVGGFLSQEFLVGLRDRIPLLVVARNLDGWDNRCLAVDNEHGGMLATQFLLDAGHTRIAMVTGIPDHEDSRDRVRGYERALKSAEVEFDQDLVFEGDFSGQSGIMAVEALLARKSNFTAIFAANDEMAFGARLALYRRGIRVPEDVSLIGFDNQPGSALMTPPLTTVAQPSMELGSAAADALLMLIAGEEVELATPELKVVVRESVIRRS